MESSGFVVSKAKHKVANGRSTKKSTNTGVDGLPSSKLVRGVKFPVSRHNPPKVDTRLDGV